MTRALLLVPLLLACGGPPPPAAPASAPEMAFQQVQPPGSRLRLALPASMRRVRHTLRYEDAALGVAVQGVGVTQGPFQPGPLEIEASYFNDLKTLLKGANRRREIALREGCKTLCHF